MNRKQTITRSTIKRPPTTEGPENEEWRDKFCHHVMRTNFQLGLTRPQLEFLCAVARDCHWNRALFRGIYAPDNFIASGHALERRGLIVLRSEEQRRKQFNEHMKSPHKHWFNDWLSNYDLTDAGWLVCELLKVTGLFVEPDASLERAAGKRKLVQ